MKRLTIQSMFAAALVVLAAGSASAQTLKADIPFPFAVGSSMMTAGTYHVRVDPSGLGRFVIFQNAATKKSAIVTVSAATAPNDWRTRGDAVVQFQAADGRYVLRQMWPGVDNRAYDFQAPKSTHGDARTAEIRMSVIKAD
jgi:hypothetical protein